MGKMKRAQEKIEDIRIVYSPDMEYKPVMSKEKNYHLNTEDIELSVDQLDILIDALHDGLGLSWYEENSTSSEKLEVYKLLESLRSAKNKISKPND